MSVYLGYDAITKQYLRSLANANAGGGSASGVDTNGFHNVW